MIKHMLTLLLLSIAVVFFMTYAHQAVMLLITSHDWLSQSLATVFSEGQAGNLIRGFIALLVLPLIIGLVPACLFWIVRRHWFPYFMEVVWIVWLVQAGALVALAKVG